MKTPIIMWGIIGAIGGYLYAKQSAASTAVGSLVGGVANGIVSGLASLFGS